MSEWWDEFFASEEEEGRWSQDALGQDESVPEQDYLVCVCGESKVAVKVALKRGSRFLTCARQE